VEIHAQVLENVLSHSILSRPRFAITIELLVSIAIGGTIIWLLPILGPFIILVVGGATAAILAGTSWYLYAQHQLLIDSTFPLASSFSLYTVLVFTNYATEQRRRRQIRLAFGQYLAPSLVEQLANAPERLVLGGEQRNVTIMFSDVRGFTTISERFKDDPQGLIALMNRLLTPLTNAIMSRKGTIDKYIGDAVMAFWNAPLDDPTHERNACDAALDMLEALEALNRSVSASGSTRAPVSWETWDRTFTSTIQ
jgi:adenylate cyclase